MDAAHAVAPRAGLASAREARFQVLAPLAGLLFIALAIGWSALHGSPLLLFFFTLFSFLFSFHPDAIPRLMRHYALRPLFPGAHQTLICDAVELSRRAGLSQAPGLFHIEGAAPNALTLGWGREAAILLSDGLLARLGSRERRGVLAHEMAHLKHGDALLMVVGEVLTRLTRLCAGLGVLLLLAETFAILPDQASLSWDRLGLFVAAPLLGEALLRRFSRQLEFHADHEAVALTGDPGGLILALERITPPPFLSGSVPALNSAAAPRWFRSHPEVSERIRRLRALL